MDDERNFIERAEDVSKNWTGEPFSDERIVQEFHLYGHAKRAQTLDAFDIELANADTSDVKKITRLASLRGEMDRVHHALRKANR